MHHTHLTQATKITFPTFIIIGPKSTPSRLYLPSAKGILLDTYNILYNYIILSFGCSLVPITDMNRYATVTYQLSEPLSARRRRTLVEDQSYTSHSVTLCDASGVEHESLDFAMIVQNLKTRIRLHWHV